MCNLIQKFTPHLEQREGDLHIYFSSILREVNFKLFLRFSLIAVNY